jgi:hypothetical protein
VRDLVFLALVVAFFAVAVLMARGCELIVRPDTTGDDAPGP